MDNNKYSDLINKSKFFQAIKQATSVDIKKPVPIDVGPKLNIGCGPNIFPYFGWINYDHERFDQYFDWLKKTDNLVPSATWAKDGPGTVENLKKLQAFIRENDINFNQQDLCKGFPQHEDNSVALIYVGQTIEHLNPIHQMPNFLRECYRMLKPGGIIRLTTPDIDILIQAYLNNKMSQFADEQPYFYESADPGTQLSFIMFGATGQNCTWSHYEGHMFLFSKKSMTTALEATGFKEIEFYSAAGKSKNPVMQDEVVDAGMTHSFIVEAVK
jgi:SAM-dependent methyltransferase